MQKNKDHIIVFVIYCSSMEMLVIYNLLGVFEQIKIFGYDFQHLDL